MGGLADGGAGNDQIGADLRDDPGMARIVTSGIGEDSIWVVANKLDGVPTSVTITDFQHGVDYFNLSNAVNVPYFGYEYHETLMRGLDTNFNGRLDGADQPNEFGSVAVTPGSLTITVGDGDSVTFTNVSAYDYLL